MCGQKGSEFHFKCHQDSLSFLIHCSSPWQSSLLVHTVLERASWGSWDAWKTSDKKASGNQGKPHGQSQVVQHQREGGRLLDTGWGLCCPLLFSKASEMCLCSLWGEESKTKIVTHYTTMRVKLFRPSLIFSDLEFIWYILSSVMRILGFLVSLNHTEI